MFHRINIRRKLRNYGKVLRASDQEELDNLRGNLLALMTELDRLRIAAGVAIISATAEPAPPVEHLSWGNDEEEEAVVPGPEPAPVPRSSQPVPPSPAQDPPPMELRPIILPSYGNAGQQYIDAEICARTVQVSEQLSNIRELIVSKSFQYSDVQRDAPRKGIVTRSRKLVNDLNEQIIYHSQVYMESRSRLVQLNANPEILKQYRILKKEDLHSSTAILNPNIAGSSTLRLSWIWESVTRRLDPGFEQQEESRDDAEPPHSADGSPVPGPGSDHITQPTERPAVLECKGTLYLVAHRSSISPM